MSEGEMSNGAMDPPVSIRLHSIPLNQYAEGRHRVGQLRRKPLLNLVAYLLAASYFGQHREGGIHRHPHIPRPTTTRSNSTGSSARGGHPRGDPERLRLSGPANSPDLTKGRSYKTSGRKCRTFEWACGAIGCLCTSSTRRWLLMPPATGSPLRRLL